MAGLQASIDQFFEDGGKLVNGGTVHAEELRSRDLCPKPILLGDVANGYELIGRDITTGTAGDHRVGASFLNVGQESIVGILNLIATAL